MEEKKKHGWSSHNSVVLSLVITWVCAGILAGCIAGAPFILPLWFNGRYEGAQLSDVIMTAFYICCPMGIGCVVSLLRLLTNIKNDSVFTEQNIRLLRILSWCCLLVAAVTAVAMAWYPPFFFVFCSSGFLALILRVVKNVIARATQIKNENDLTI